MAHTKATARYLAFCQHVRTLVDEYPSSVTSWWRTKKRNDRVGGHPRSFHLEDLAADLVPDNVAHVPRIAARAQQLGLQAVRYSERVHVELDYRSG